MTHTAVKNEKSVSFNTATLKITVIDIRRNAVYSVLPTEDWEFWDLLMQQYFSHL